MWLNKNNNRGGLLLKFVYLLGSKLKVYLHTTFNLQQKAEALRLIPSRALSRSGSKGIISGSETAVDYLHAISSPPLKTIANKTLFIKNHFVANEKKSG